MIEMRLVISFYVYFEYEISYIKKIFIFSMFLWFSTELITTLIINTSYVILKKNLSK